MRKGTIGILILAAAVIVLLLFYGPAIFGPKEDTSATEAQMAPLPPSPADMAPKVPSPASS